MAWFAVMGADTVAYHEENVLGRADDHPGQALDYYGSRGETPLRWGGTVAEGPVFTQIDIDVTMPRPPRVWGPRIRFDSLTSLTGLTSHTDLLGLTAARMPPGYSARNTGSTVIEFDAVDLRPHRAYDLDEVPIIVAASLTGSIEGTWTATATNRDGQSRGTIKFALADECVDVIDLLQADD